MKHLFVIPHPDDESCGPSPLIHHLCSRGDHVHILVMCVTNFTSMRTGKATDTDQMMMNLGKSLNILGGVNITYSVFRTALSLFNEDEYDITGFIDSETKRYQPEYVYFPMDAFHHDHKRIHNCCLASTRYSRHNTSVKRYYFYEYPFSQSQLNSVGSHYVELDKSDVDAAVESCKVYSHLMDTNSLFSPDGIRHMFEMRGYEIAKDYAIKLTLFKSIESI